ncbi:hypothetical protein EJB05_46603 [Eragrostis curvula]|uniref:Uncharacterized protein n=1 Tax=Eragrostis curvula TaxID=38414 RepID=A0A5J9TNH1_9POAL|nr:hypothetical protein EJB05_46603 [Eragrostis curvula]
MGHIADPGGAVVIGCKVLPIFNERGIMDGAMKKVVHRIDGKKAVTRVKELLKRAAQARPHRGTVGGKKWKVLSFQAASDSAKGGQQQQHEQTSDDVSCSSSKLSFKWDVGSCSSVSASSALYSPLSLVSAPAKAADQMLTPSRKHYCMSRLSSMSQHSASVLEPAIASMVYSSSSPKSMKSMEGEEGTCRMGQWITTDSDSLIDERCTDEDGQSQPGLRGAEAADKNELPPFSLAKKR